MIQPSHLVEEIELLEELRKGMFLPNEEITAAFVVGAISALRWVTEGKSRPSESLGEGELA